MFDTVELELSQVRSQQEAIEMLLNLSTKKVEEFSQLNHQSQLDQSQSLPQSNPLFKRITKKRKVVIQMKGSPDKFQCSQCLLIFNTPNGVYGHLRVHGGKNKGN